jgi:tetratricopeptide (TPR) repeat protein
MSQANLLSPPTHIPPPTALALSQKAPLILAHPPTSSLPWPLSLLFSRETPESWTIHENLFYSALRTGDETAAKAVLERLEARFGDQNERIITLRGIYNEATAQSDSDLEKVFEGYEKILREDPTNMSVRKRRVAVLKALGRTQDAITAVTMLLQNSPTDVEAWAEASELYASQGAWGQAIYCAEEVLLVMPNAWSVRLPTYLLPPSHSITNYVELGTRTRSNPPLPLRILRQPPKSPRPRPRPKTLLPRRRAQRRLSARLLRPQTRELETAHSLVGRAVDDCQARQRTGRRRDPRAQSRERQETRGDCDKETRRDCEEGECG